MRTIEASLCFIAILTQVGIAEVMAKMGGGNNQVFRKEFRNRGGWHLLWHGSQHAWVFPGQEKQLIGYQILSC